MLLARKNADGSRTQSLQEHTSEVSKKTAEFASEIGLGYCGKLCGFAHNYGKSFPRWQKERLELQKEVPHSIYGAILLKKVFSSSIQSKMTSQFLGCAILGHHGGLYDQINQSEPEANYFRLQNSDYQDCEQYFNECVSHDTLKKLSEKSEAELIPFWQIAGRIVKSSNTANYGNIVLSLLLRYIYSCLIDADRMDAARWEMQRKDEVEFTGEKFWETYYKNLCSSLEKKLPPENATEKERNIYTLRQEISKKCDLSAEKDEMVCQLYVSTGGGKTLAGLRFALKYAMNPDNKIRRIYYIIPYTTILEQTAGEINKAIGSGEGILQHYSSYIPDEEDELNYEMAVQRWNAPIVLTTQVQFLNALYSGKTQAARRMHQLADSILIFDEIQTIPLHCISLFNCAISFLTGMCGCTAILCSATQPKLAETMYPMPVPKQLIEIDKDISNSFKRVKVNDLSFEKYDIPQIVELIESQKEESILVILNTKASVLSLYEELKIRNTSNLYHLSTSMCSAHRMAVLVEIRLKLGKERLICVSTNLIEAGVDISFGCVIRSLAGLDSIMQAAGRCNRHGELKGLGQVYIINERDSNIRRMPDLISAQEAARDVLTVFRSCPERLENDLLSKTSIDCYYRKYYSKAAGKMNYPTKKI